MKFCAEKREISDLRLIMLQRGKAVWMATNKKKSKENFSASLIIFVSFCKMPFSTRSLSSISAESNFVLKVVVKHISAPFFPFFCFKWEKNFPFFKGSFKTKGKNRKLLMLLFEQQWLQPLFCELSNLRKRVL